MLKTKFNMPLVRDCMQPNVVTVDANMPLEEIAALFTDQMISGAPVVDDEMNVLGVVSLSDLAAHSTQQHLAFPREYYRDLWMEDEVADGFVIEEAKSGLTAQDIMTPRVHQVRDDDPLPEAVDLMLKTRIHRVLVSNGRSIVGIVSTTDLVRMLPDLLQQRLEAEEVS